MSPKSVTGFGNGGSVFPTPTGKNSGRSGAIRQTSEVLAVETFKTTKKEHPAAAVGNTATVKDSLHTSQPGGAKHMTVDFQNPAGKHVTRLHIASDGALLQGDAQPPVHAAGHVPPNNTPSSTPPSR